MMVRIEFNIKFEFGGREYTFDPYTGNIGREGTPLRLVYARVPWGMQRAVDAACIEHNNRLRRAA